MTYVVCHCGHGKGGHNPQCPLCDCPIYRPASDPDPLLKQKVSVTHVDKLLETAVESSDRKILGLLRRIMPKLEELEIEVMIYLEEREKESKRLELEREALEKVNTLRRKLQEAEENLATILPVAAKKTPSRRGGVTKRGHFPCPTCGEVKDTPQGLGAHRAQKHGYRKGSDNA